MSQRAAFSLPLPSPDVLGMGKARGSSSRARRGSSNTYAPHKRSGAPPPSSTVKYYAVQRGKDGFRGVLTTWADCRKYVIGHKGSVYKSFRSAAEAEAFTLDSPTATAPQGMEQQETPARRERVGTVRCPEPVNRATGGSSAHLVLYTDGACSKNGKKGSRAGYGVYFGENDPRNISAPLPGKATNQRAEMMAVLVAMRSVLDDHMLAPGGTLTIRTDSMVCYGCSLFRSLNVGCCFRAV